MLVKCCKNTANMCNINFVTYLKYHNSNENVFDKELQTMTKRQENDNLQTNHKNYLSTHYVVWVTPQNTY